MHVFSLYPFIHGKKYMQKVYSSNGFCAPPDCFDVVTAFSCITLISIYLIAYTIYYMHASI